ncbi:MAG: UDP-N-acetylmuramate dehydrogenase [Campylobacterota bacterium]|nr:UDP-N-acetylmuramate dehydrogenase [Campylobacterota bacterium]
MPYKTIDFSKFSSIKIGPKVDVFLIEDETYPSDHQLIGMANNLLVSPNSPPLMMLSKKYDSLHVKENKLTIGAATPSGKIVSFCKKHDIAGFEFLSRLPGTLGGMLKMNAGLKEYEIFNNLLAIRTKEGWIDKEDLEYGYRFTNIEDVVFEALFTCKRGFSLEQLDIFKAMRSNQPSNPSAGSAFKNPQNDYAGRLIEAVGLKGKCIGSMAFSEMHANFLINLGEGSYEEAIALIELAEKKVKAEFDISLEREIIVIKA